MNNHRFIFFILLIGYIFTPTLFNWLISPEGSWYKPFILWIFIIIGAYLFQRSQKLS